ncbi:acetyltransferase [Oceanobacillus picturae]|uniref:acetyltransferase n=1 Tax=Oceanobacillus picturae TaxID=171693 RepID=UPI0015FF8141|nr:acetyltransferase [Oceanobacillus picturae]
MKLILIGAGGHSKVVQDIIAENKDLKLHAILDDSLYETVEVDDVIYSSTRMLDSLQQEDYKYCIAIGSNHIRKKIFEKLSIPMNQYITLIHPSAVISKTAKIGNGTVVMPNVVINADSVIGNQTIINTGSIVEHDNLLKDYVHVSPSATLTGTVSVGEGTHIGAGAVVIPGKRIGSWSTIGAGGVVIDNITDNITVVGTPAKPYRKL